MTLKKLQMVTPESEDLDKLDHWPDRVEAVEGEWRDYYTGEPTWKKRELFGLERNNTKKTHKKP